MPFFLKKPKLNKINSDKNNLTKSEQLKAKRNKLNYEKYRATPELLKNESVFVKNFIDDSRAKAVPIAKSVFSGNYKNAANQYVEIVSNYKKYLELSNVSKKNIEKWSLNFKRSLIRSLVAIIKKEVSKKIIKEQSKLSAKKLKEISDIEEKVISDLYISGFIKNIEKLPGLYLSETNAFEAIINSNYFDKDPIKLFKNITNIYEDLKKGKRSKSTNKLVKGVSRIIYSKDLDHIHDSIAVNTYLKKSRSIIIHELIHSYLKREGNRYGSNEIVVEFLSTLLARKHFRIKYKRKPSKDFKLNQYYVGVELSKAYVKNYGYDLTYIPSFLDLSKEVIKKYSKQ